MNMLVRVSGRNVVGGRIELFEFESAVTLPHGLLVGVEIEGGAGGRTGWCRRDGAAGWNEAAQEGNQFSVVGTISDGLEPRSIAQFLLKLRDLGRATEQVMAWGHIPERLLPPLDEPAEVRVEHGVAAADE